MSVSVRLVIEPSSLQGIGTRVVLSVKRPGRTVRYAGVYVDLERDGEAGLLAAVDLLEHKLGVQV